MITNIKRTQISPGDFLKRHLDDFLNFSKLGERKDWKHPFCKNNSIQPLELILCALPFS